MNTFYHTVGARLRLYFGHLSQEITTSGNLVFICPPETSQFSDMYLK